VILQRPTKVDLKEIVTMTANPNSIDLSTFVSEHLERAEPDLLRSILQTFVEALMGAEADAICGAPYGVRSEERTNSRNGYRAREWDTRTGTLEVAIPKLRQGSYFPTGCWSAAVARSGR
jgi:transposase-like protein